VTPWAAFVAYFLEDVLASSGLSLIKKGHKDREKRDKKETKGRIRKTEAVCVKWETVKTSQSLFPFILLLGMLCGMIHTLVNLSTFLLFTYTPSFQIDKYNYDNTTYTYFYYWGWACEL